MNRPPIKFLITRSGAEGSGTKLPIHPPPFPNLCGCAFSHVRISLPDIIDLVSASEHTYLGVEDEFFWVRGGGGKGKVGVRVAFTKSHT